MRRTAIAVLVCSLSLPAFAEVRRGDVMVAVDTGERTRGGVDEGRSTLLSIGGEIYGPAGSPLANLGLVAAVTMTLHSSDMSEYVILADSIYGSPSWTGGQVALRGRAVRGDSEAGLSLGAGSMQFSYAERDLIDIVGLVVAPVDTYRYARLGVDGRLRSARAAAFASAGARYVFDGNNEVVLGFDAEGGLGYRVAGPIELRVSAMFEEFRARAFRDRAVRGRLSLAARW